MRTISLIYHDIVEANVRMDSGLRPSPAAYALNPESFRSHLQALQRSPAASAISTIDTRSSWSGRPSIFITFDDGAIGACQAADELERFGWRGHFFITTSWIGSRGFLTRSQIRDLHDREHVIGSHTVSHPPRMSALSWHELMGEWRDSRSELMDMLGADVPTASVANGYYSWRVGAAAAEAGFQVLFTSEPSVRVSVQDGCLVLGRYSIHRGMSAAECAAIANGARRPRFRQAATWQIKKAAKAIGGEFYLTARARLLSRTSASVWH